MSPTRIPSLAPMSSNLVLLLVVLILLLQPKSTHAGPAQQPLTKYQEKVNHAWNHLVSDFDLFKDLFAKDAKIKMCLKGMPFCTEGTFEEMLEGFRVAFSSFHVKHKFLTGSYGHADSFLVEWVNSVETREGCKGIWWGYATYEFNEDGKVKRFLGLSEESEDVINCVHKVSGINAEL